MKSILIQPELETLISKHFLATLPLADEAINHYWSVMALIQTLLIS
jgi:hypothetical protein